MVELPEEVLNHIKSFIPKDRHMRSATFNTIKPFVNFYNELDSVWYWRIPFTTSHSFQDFMRDPFHLLYKGSIMTSKESMICSLCEKIRNLIGLVVMFLLENIIVMKF